MLTGGNTESRPGSWKERRLHKFFTCFVASELLGAH